MLFFWESCHISDLRPGKQPPYNGLRTCPEIKAFSVPRNLPDINRLSVFQLSSATRGRAADAENSFFHLSLSVVFISLASLFVFFQLWYVVKVSAIQCNFPQSESKGGYHEHTWG